MEWLLDSDISNPSSSFPVGLPCSPHWLAVFIALFPSCHLTGLYHMHGLPLWLGLGLGMLRLKGHLNMDIMSLRCTDVCNGEGFVSSCERS